MFFPSKCSLFHNSNVFGSCIIHILYTGCAKIKKKNNSGTKKLVDADESVYKGIWVINYGRTTSNRAFAKWRLKLDNLGPGSGEMERCRWEGQNFQLLKEVQCLKKKNYDATFLKNNARQGYQCPVSSPIPSGTHYMWLRVPEPISNSAILRPSGYGGFKDNASGMAGPNPGRDIPR